MQTGEAMQWIRGDESASTVICNYVKPTTEEGKLEVAEPLPQDIVVDDAAELTEKELTLNLKYPEGTTQRAATALPQTGTIRQEP